MFGEEKTKSVDLDALKELIEKMNQLMGEGFKSASVEVKKGADEEEMEHGIDKGMAEKLASDHVSKDPGYYEEGKPEHEGAESPMEEKGEHMAGGSEESTEDLESLMDEYKKRKLRV